MAEILFEKVQKRFKETVVIRDLNLIINDGEFFTFVGPSGCGKSTLLNMIAGLESVTEGNIYFNGAIVNDLTPGERDVAMVFQSYALYPHMTVFDNIAFPLRMKKIDRVNIEGEVNRVAQALGLSDMLHRKPKELSGGQRQRVALGRAIIRNPRVFLMDEPLSNLDARLRVDMRGELKRLHRELRITTVYVTHDQSEAMSLSDRIAVLDNGEMQQCGTPFEIYMKPSNTFVAGFIGSPLMNFIPAVVRGFTPVEVDCNGILLSPFVDRPPERENVIAGIRPEDVIITSKEGGNAIAVTVSIIEPAGSFNWVVCNWNNLMIKGNSIAGEDLGPGDSAFMKLAHSKIILFDQLTGKRI